MDVSTHQSSKSEEGGVNNFEAAGDAAAVRRGQPLRLSASVLGSVRFCPCTAAGLSLLTAPRLCVCCLFNMTDVKALRLRVREGGSTYPYCDADLISHLKLTFNPIGLKYVDS